MDSQGQQGLNFSQLTKVLFRIAHEWAVNIDLDEYLELLTKIYQRIILRMSKQGYSLNPSIIVS